jgi:sulfate adenylyltransferase subunit 1 (EFTu-like GTPase family)
MRNVMACPAPVCDANHEAVKRVAHQIAIELRPATKAYHSRGRPLQLNDIGIVNLKTLSPLAFDSYDRNKETGSLVLIDEADYQTVAAGMLSQDIERRFSSWTRQVAL